MSRYRTALYTPGWLSVVVNPFYFIRRGIHRGIRGHAHRMHGRMLDFGCGTMPYRSLLHVDEYVGLDVQPRDTDVVVYDGRIIPFPDASFDAVLTSEVLDDIVDVGAALAEILRVMKPGAELLVTAPFIWDDPDGSRDFARYTAFGIRELLESAGFTVESVAKSTTAVETIVQLWIAWVVQCLFPANRIVRGALTLLLVFPANVAGIVLSAMLPDDGRLYHNNIVLARKPASPI